MITQDELEIIRCKVPEPTWTQSEEMRFLIPTAFQPWKSWNMEIPSVMETVPIGRLTKKRFAYPGCVYEAWTHDGKTPLFPIPHNK